MNTHMMDQGCNISWQHKIVMFSETISKKVDGYVILNFWYVLENIFKKKNDTTFIGKLSIYWR